MPFGQFERQVLYVVYAKKLIEHTAKQLPLVSSAKVIGEAGHLITHDIVLKSRNCPKGQVRPHFLSV